ncbi:BTAD domain-containing putative transcriptional regulator [Actinosynnema sp. NPDC050801]|uniref:AfsR/SARP family transcriptional regulator n=1 Tax=unclassified Actinosynnema TaxID=2637065 RepID=UPI0033E5C03E
MYFGVLGPVEVLDGGERLATGSARERFVLATLLLGADRLVTADALVDALWPDPPSSARAQLHNMISNLRRRLHASGELIASRPGGYQLSLGPHGFDLAEFRALVNRGRRAGAETDHAGAVAALTKALALWRGPALADVADESVGAVRQALHDEKLAAVEARLDAELALGRADVVLAEVPALIAEHPFREFLHEKQMLALVAAGRRADALTCYQRVHRLFAEELGIEPGRSLRHLHQRILRDDASEPDRGPEHVVPRQLPPRPPVVTGRDDLLDRITTALRPTGDVAPVGLLVGPGGIGKTTLALVAAHQSVHRFPDGHLYADLRGSSAHPADPHAVTARFLRALGVAASALPEDPDERVALYRSRLAGTRTLVVLEDVAAEKQVRPLLPGSGGCAVLVTSRRALAALVGVHRWTVPVLRRHDAIAVLTSVVGHQRVRAEPEAAAAVVESCGRLPLAVSIAAARLAVRPQWTLAEFADRLAEHRGRLDELSIGDLDVRASIGLTYHALSPGQRLVLRRLGLIAAPDWPAWVARAVAGTPDADRLLDQLVEVHLVEPVGRARYRLHDLVADYAVEQATTEEGEQERTAAQIRVLNGWLALLTAADEVIDHGTDNAAGLAAPPLPDGASPPSRDTALDWCETERISLLTAVDQACALGEAYLAGALALRLVGFLQLRAYDDDRDHALRTAIDAVTVEGHHDLSVRLLHALFLASLQMSRYTELPAVADRQVHLAWTLGDPARQAGALHHRGVAALMTGRLGEAAGWFEQAIAVAREARLGGQFLAKPLRGLADVHAESGRPEQSLPLFQEALEVERDERPSRQTAILLRRYGMALIDVGSLDEAERVLTESAGIARAVGDEFGLAAIGHTAADVDIALGRLDRAAARLDELRVVQDKRANWDGLASVLRSLADIAALCGRWPDAVDLLRDTVELRRRAADPLDVARALARLARARAAVGDSAAARACDDEAQAVVAGLGLEEACLRRPPFPR